MACDCLCACDECGTVRHAISGHPLPKPEPKEDTKFPECLTDSKWIGEDKK